VIYLLSAQSYPALSWQAPIETLETNVVGTANVYEAIKVAAIDPVVVVACSSAQYGEVSVEDVPVKESHPLRPMHPYGVSKAATEMLALQYWYNNKIRSVCARIFNTTGPRKSGDVCADFTQRMARIEAGLLPPVLKVGNLQTHRAITDVRDLASGLHLREPGTQILLRRVGGAGCRSRIDVFVHDSSRFSLEAHYSRDEHGKATVWQSPAGSCGDSLTRTIHLSLFRGSHAQLHRDSAVRCRHAWRLLRRTSGPARATRRRGCSRTGRPERRQGRSRRTGAFGPEG